MFRKSVFISVAIILLSISITLAQTVTEKTVSPSADSSTNKSTAESPGVINAAIRSQILEATIKQFNEMYVFPEVAKEIEKAVRARIEKKEYDQFTDGEAFAKKLTGDLQEVSHDKHAFVIYTDKLLGDKKENATPAQIEEKRLNDIRANYGIPGAQVLPGNIGYLELRGLRDPSLAGEKLAAAMNLLSDTDALIIDLRKAPGGSGEMVALIVSYLIGSKPVLLNTVYVRKQNETLESWTLKDVPGKRYLGKNVYVLTSKFSFSAAEELAYDLQTQKRATLVGETTAGGANPNEFVRLNEHFQLSVPFGRAINPITKTNWEGIGVKPDVSVPAEQALKTAQILALQQISEKSTSEADKAALTKIIASIQAELDELKKKKTAS